MGKDTTFLSQISGNDDEYLLQISGNNDNFLSQISGNSPGSSGIWSDGIPEGVLTKTIKTPDC